MQLKYFILIYLYYISQNHSSVSFAYLNYFTLCFDVLFFEGQQMTCQEYTRVCPLFTPSEKYTVSVYVMESKVILLYIIYKKKYIIQPYLVTLCA